MAYSVLFLGSYNEAKAKEITALKSLNYLLSPKILEGVSGFVG